MKIKSISARWLSVPLAPAQQHVSDFGASTTFDTTLVRVETECGLVGHGEGKAAVGSNSVNAPIVTSVEKELSPSLVGQDPRDITCLWERMYNGSRANFALDRGRSFPILGRRGVSVAALSGIDMAVWDIFGQSLGVPVWRLLGGKCRDRLPVYASGGHADAKGIGDELLGHVERLHCKAVKMRVGSMDGSVRRSVQRVRAARAALGEDIDIMVDAHGTFSVAEAQRFAREVEDCNLGWFEEPVSPDNHAGYAQVRNMTDIPIAGGESEYTRFDFRDLIGTGGVDILQPDPAICGGITEAMRIATLGGTYQLGLAPHLWGGAFNFAAGLHVAAAAPNAFILEYSARANPMLNDLVAESFAVEDDGTLVIPDRPGLGLTVNRDFVERFTVR